ncbi:MULTISPECIES: hypothetical protein [unclassified Nitrobacter]|uniref:hypothetical protein n=1 Tax=unclassified Nitrobacter TaxID=2620411 RepID=UPI000927E8C7|nr:MULTISPECIES: hypothetical protein [unclassified Nitrobacter]MBN9147072.1 hypothetical protein [Nitrobacter sp.]OJV02416.1 MAG: hypothetical protein BGO16_02450 [Nitrobacter sp. 62-23]
MTAMIVVAVMLIGMMCVLAYTLATYALPFMLALAVTRFAFGTGAGWVGAAIVGLAAGAASFAILAFLFDTLRAPILRIALALIFAAPAAVAGYALVHGVTGEAVPSPVWRQIFCLAGGAMVGAAAVIRLAASAGSES